MIYEKISLSDTDDSVFLEVYATEKIKDYPSKKALLVIPGGGYGHVCADREGEQVALAFMPYGYNAFVLHYTVGRKKTFPCQLIEAARAIKHIKDNAERYNVNPDELFVVGFSAGGHLAASTGVLWKLDEIYKSVDMPYGYNKPKGVMLIYPVVSPKFQRHIASFKNLWCTDEPTAEQLFAAAIEEHVDGDTVPAFILHTANDGGVDVRNSLVLADAYSREGVPFELHIYPNGPHGFALANEMTGWSDRRVAEWVRLAAQWAKTV